MKNKDREDFIRVAKSSVEGLKDSHVMLGFWGSENKPERWQFIMQIGYALLHNKPILIVLPEGASIPPKLALIAEVIEYYQPGDLDSMHEAARRALVSFGAIEQTH